MDFHDAAATVRMNLQRQAPVGDNAVAVPDRPRLLVDRLQRAYRVRVGVEQVGADVLAVPLFVLAVRGEKRVVAVDDQSGGGWAEPQIGHFTSPLMCRTTWTNGDGSEPHSATIVK